MASPQTENGFTRLADELLDALIRYPFTKRQYKVLLAVIRKTYGFHKLEDDITAPQLAQMTGLDRANVIRAINELVTIGALSKRPGRFGQVLRVHKDYETWEVPKRHRSDQAVGGAKTTPHPVPDQHREGCRNDTAASAETAPSINNPQQTSPTEPPPQTAAGEGEDRRGGDELIFPREMSSSERLQAQGLVAPAGADAQAILDVLAATIQAGEVRKSHLAVLGGLVRRHQAGTFDPTPGLHLAEHRRRAAAVEAAQRKQEQQFAQQLATRMPSGDGRAAFQQMLKKLNRGRAG